MSPTLAYAASCLLLVVIGLTGSWPLLDAAGRNAVLAAAFVALPLQVVAFAALVWGRRNTARFLTAWIGGTLARFAAVVLAAVGVVLLDLPPAPALLSLAGFLLGMIFLEPVFLVNPSRPVAEH